MLAVQEPVPGFLGADAGVPLGGERASSHPAGRPGLLLPRTDTPDYFSPKNHDCSGNWEDGVAAGPASVIAARKANAYDRLKTPSSMITTYRMVIAATIVPTTVATKLGPRGSKCGAKATSEMMKPITPPTRVAISLERRPYLYKTAEENSTRYTAIAPIATRMTSLACIRLSAFTPFRGSSCQYSLKARPLLARMTHGVSLEYRQCRRRWLRHHLLRTQRPPGPNRRAPLG